MFSPEYGVLLAETLKTQDPTNYWWSEKIDGVRGIWTGSQLLTRNNNKIYAPDWFLSQLPTTSLDGELFSTNFTTTLSIVSKKTPITSEWEKITFHVFDIPEIIAPYEQRLNTLISFRINSESLVWNILHPIQIKDPSHFHILHNQVIDSGGEGSMLRQPGSFYNTHRSPTLLKHKNFHDQEAIIKQHIRGSGQFTGALGKLIVVWKNNPTITFKVGTGFTKEIRFNYLNTLPLNSVITVKYNELSKSGKPRFPVYIGQRFDP